MRAYKNSRMYKEKVKCYHDKHVKRDKKFKKEEQVLLFNSRLRIFLGNLKSKWTRPFTVT